MRTGKFKSLVKRPAPFITLIGKTIVSVNFDTVKQILDISQFFYRKETFVKQNHSHKNRRCEMKPREKIINRRKEKGLTSKRVSELIGITQGGYSHIESGSRNLTVPVAKRLAKVLDMHWTEFFED